MFLPYIPAVVGSHILVAAAGSGGSIPTIDVRGTCQVAAGAMVRLIGGTTTENALSACLSSEQSARELLVKGWSTFSGADRQQCVRTDVYLPSYVEWITCLEMERDVRKMRQQDAENNSKQRR
jgi:hypothetical protein